MRKLIVDTNEKSITRINEAGYEHVIDRDEAELLIALLASTFPDLFADVAMRFYSKPPTSDA